MTTKNNKNKKVYKLTSVEVEEKLMADVKVKLLNNKESFRGLVEKAMKQYLTEEN